MINPLRKTISLLTLIAILLLVGCGNAETPTTKDTAEGEIMDGKFRLVESDGTELILDKTPERIVVLSVATAEIMHHLGIPIVGITSTSRELSEGLRDLPQVGIPMNPDMERIANLTPDLVIMSRNFKAAHNDNFREFGLNVFFIDNQRYTDTENSIRLLAEAFGKEASLEEILNPIKKREKALLHSIKDREKPTVMIIFGNSDTFFMARNNSFSGEMVNILGAINIADKLIIDDAMASMIPLSVEQAVKLNPQVILRIAHGNPREVQRLYEREFATNPIWQSIDAVQNNRVYDLSTELFFANPGLKAIDSLEELASILFP